MTNIYNPLIDNKPTHYLGYTLNTCFRVVLLFFKLLNDDSLSDEEKTITALQMFYFDGENKVDMNKASELIDYITFYIKLGHIEEDTAEEKEDKGVFDFDMDSGRIYAAFLQIYGIDLTKSNLHWWDFSTLLNGLPEGTKLSSVIGIRSMKVPKATKDNRDYVAQIRELKRVYSLNKKPVGAKLCDIFNSWG